MRSLAIAAALGLALGASAPSPASAQDAKVDIRKVACSELDRA
jgi:uncharacterized membrane protein